jgi:hypothetical protein
MRKTAAVLAALGIVAVFAAAVPAPAQNRRVTVDLWLRQISNDQNLDGDHTSYYVAIYRKQGPQGEEHRIVGPRLVGEWRVVNNKGVGPNVADRLIRASFFGNTRYVIRITHGDGRDLLPGNPVVEYALDAGNHVIAIGPEPMYCSTTPDRQPGIYLKEPAHTWLWITVEVPGLSQPEKDIC